MLVASTMQMPLARTTGLLFVEDGAELLAVMPFASGRRTGRPRTRVVGTRTPYLDSQGSWDHPLVSDERPDDAMAALLRGKRSLRLPPLVEFTNLPIGGRLEQALVSAAARAKMPLVELDRTEFVYSMRTPLPLDADAEKTRLRVSPAVAPSLEHFNARLRKDLVRRSRALVAVLGEELRLEDLSEDPAAIETYFALEGRGWKGDATRGGDGLRVRGLKDWFRAVTRRYRADGDLIVLALKSGEEIIHMRVSTRIGDTVFGWVDTYDERFSSFRAGVLGRVASMNHILALNGVRFFDPNLHPDVVEAKLLYADREYRAKILVATGGTIPRLIVPTLRAVRAYRRAARR